MGLSGSWETLGLVSRDTLALLAEQRIDREAGSQSSGSTHGGLGDLREEEAQGKTELLGVGRKKTDFP